jgi:hypothetical protein
MIFSLGCSIRMLLSSPGTTVCETHPPRLLYAPRVLAATALPDAERQQPGARLRR